MPTYPASRSIIYDRETYSGGADSATMVRRLMQWENWTWANEDRRCPAAGAYVFGDAGGSPAYKRVVAGMFTRTSYSGEVCRIPVQGLDPSFPSMHVEFYVVATSSAGASPVVRVQNSATAAFVDTTIPSGASGWYGVDIPVFGPCDVLVTKTQTAGCPLVAVQAVSAWMNGPASLPGVTFQAWAPISQLYSAIPGNPDSAFPLRWLARRANYFALYRPPQMFNSAWNATVSENTAAGTLLRYKIVVAPGVKTLAFHICAISGQSASVRYNVTLGGVTQVASAAPYNVFVYSPYAWVAYTFPVNGGAGYSVPTAVELTVGHNGTGAGVGMGILGVSVWENNPSAVDLALPGGQTVPAAWAPLYDEQIVARAAIRATTDALGRNVGRGPMVANMIHLYGQRYGRALVVDCCQWVWDFTNITLAFRVPLSAPIGSGTRWIRLKLAYHVVEPDGATALSVYGHQVNPNPESESTVPAWNTTDLPGVSESLGYYDLVISGYVRAVGAKWTERPRYEVGDPQSAW